VIRTNPVPTHWVEDDLVSERVVAAHDAYEMGRTAEALEMLVGEPATVSIGSDACGVKVVRATATTLTVETSVHTATFRLTKRGWRAGSHRLAVGQAYDYRDPSF
jgi:hypothetical protein